MRVVGVMVLTVCLSAFVGAQALSVSGHVADPHGAMVGNAMVTLTARGASSGVRTTRSAADGSFSFAGVQPGVYLLQVESPGFQHWMEEITVGDQTLTGQSRTVDITLQVGGVATSVDVVGAAGGALANSLSANTTAGSRLDLTALDTPASVTTLSGTDIRLRGDVSVNSAVTRAVGITSTLSVGGGGNTVAARGFGGSSVAFLYDGIRNQAGLGNMSWPYDPWTVDRIEVLNGPASVLFGIGGIGGSINVVPRRPSREAQHTARIAGASYNTYKLALDSTGPVSDRVLYRVDVSRQASNGYINRGTSDSTAVSGSVAFLISDKLKATVMNDFSHIEPMNYNGLPMVNGATLPSLLKENYGTSDVDVHFNENSTRFEVEWTPSPGVAVRSITSLLRGKRLWKMGPQQLNYRPATNDIIRGGFGKFEQDQTQWNDQIEVTVRRRVLGRDNTLVVGGDGEWLDYTRYVTQWPGITDVVSLIGPTPGSYPTVNGTITQAQNNRVHRYSAFTEDRLKVTPALSLVAGLRWDTQQFRRIDLVTAAHTEVDRTYNPVNWRAGAVYELVHDTNLYAQYSAATDALSNACCVTAAQMAFDASRGRQIEAGIKQSIRGGRAEWTLAGYRIVKNDLLIPDPIQIATLIQVGSQSSQGVEATVAFDLGGGLRVGANGTVLRPRFDQFFESVGGVRVSRNGNRPTNVPWQSGNLLATWAFRPSWLAQGTLRFVGDRYIDTANTLVLPAYRVVDASLRKSVSHKVTIDFRVNNLSDAFYAYNFSSNGRGGGNWNVGMPRSFEVALTAGF